MGKTFDIEKLRDAPAAFVGLASRINQLIKAVRVLSEMKGDGNINVAVTDSNVLFTLAGEGGVGGGPTTEVPKFLYVIPDGSNVIVETGAVGNVTPSGVDSSFTPGAEVWVKVVMEAAGFQSFAVASAVIQTGAATPASDAPDSSTGAPGTDFYIKLADIDGSDIANTGNGSLGFATYITGRICVEGEGESPDEIIDVKNISFYRMQP